MRTPWSRRLLTAFIVVGACLALGGCATQPAQYSYYGTPPSYYGYPPDYSLPFDEPPSIFVPEGGHHENEEFEEEQHESPQQEIPQQEEQQEHEHHR